MAQIHNEITEWVVESAVNMLVQQGIDPFTESNNEKLSMYMGFVLGRLYAQTLLKERT